MSNDTLNTAINDGMRFRFLCDFGPHTWNVSIETDGEGKQKTEYANWSCSVASDYGTNQWDDDLRAMIDIAIGYLSEQDQERLKAAQGEQAPDQPITDEKAKGYRPPFCDRGIAGSKCCDEGCQADIELSEMYATGEQAPAQQQPVAERFALYWIGDSDPRPVGGKNMKLYQSAEEAAEKLLPAQRHQYDVRKMFVYPAVAVGEQSQPALQQPIAWIQYLDGIKTQNVARDQEEKAAIEQIAKLMVPTQKMEWLPLYAAVGVSQPDMLTMIVARLDKKVADEFAAGRPEAAGYYDDAANIALAAGEQVAQAAQDPLQVLTDQAQELDMGYGPNACRTCGKSQPAQEEQSKRTGQDDCEKP